ncbi:aspartate aminotransferase [Trichoderma evansii]
MALEHPFEHIAEGQLETGSTLQALYLEDPHPDKVNLLQGAYEADVGRPFVPQSVILARKKLLQDTGWNHDYLPFLGAPGLLKAGEELFFGLKASPATLQLIASMQAVGATGAIHMGARFLKAHYPAWQQSDCAIYLAKDTWANHCNVFQTLGIQAVDLPYYNASTKSLDWSRYREAIEGLPPRSVILLQTAAHNPTGCDPTPEQWQELIQIFVARNYFAFLDSSYLGLVSGDAEEDASVIRMFQAAGVPLLLAATFGKTFGLYGERVGMLSIVAPNSEVRGRIRKQMALLIRSETGASPAFGARVVQEILGDYKIRAAWEQDIKAIAVDLKHRRQMLRDELELLETPGNWEFLTRQAGMFSCLDFSPSQVEFLREEHHIYIDRSGRLSFAAINIRMIKLVAQAINDMIHKCAA